MNDKFRKLFPCYFSFLVNGAMVLSVGAVLPFIMEEAGLNYSVAGGLLSAFAIGNLLASFVNPVLSIKLGRKITTVLLTAFIPIAWILIQMLPSVYIMYMAFVLMGIGRGSVSIINNIAVNEYAEQKTKALNLLHMTFAIGAFLSPFMTSIFLKAGLGWRAIVYTIIVGSVLTVFGYMMMTIDDTIEAKSSKNDNKNKTENKEKAYYKNSLFYIMGFLLFLYLGLENCVNGWFVTYFKSSGIMSVTYATNLVSITWVMVMAGRLLTAKLSEKIDKSKLVFVYCTATMIFFVMLIATSNLAVITVAIAGLGFFFAGIYPTCIACVGSIIKGSGSGMSMFLAIAALGGIVTPQIVGILADKYSMNAAIMILMINAIGMFILAITNLKKLNFER